MPTSRIDHIFHHMILNDMDDEDNLIILRQEISNLSNDELNCCLKISKKYQKNYGFFYEALKRENDYRRK